MNSKFEMVDSGDPEELVLAVQKALFEALQDSLNRLKNEMDGRPGLTWEQLEFIIDTFKARNPVIIRQDFPV